MLKYNTFYNNESNRRRHDESIEKFLEVLSNDGHTLISINTISFGEYKNVVDIFRTEIVYRENCTRKVIMEKTDK